MDYEKAYKFLFNKTTDAIAEIYESRIITMEMEKGLKILKEAQKETEEMYIAQEKH